jgi:hypothetical protein
MPAVISKTVLVLAEEFAGLGAAAVATALARGLEAGEALECDRCPLADTPHGAATPGTTIGTPDRTASAAALLDACDFDARMRASRALVIAARELDDRALAGSVVFEAATRARQGGVPAYAVTARDRLDPFEARIVDLQVVLEAGDARALAAAGRKFAALV